MTEGPKRCRGSQAKRRRGPQQLSLAARGGRGGFRANAGRKGIPEHRRRFVAHARRELSFRRGTLHVTLRMVDGLPSLRRARTVRWIRRCLELSEKDGFRVVHYSVQENHLHLLVEAESERPFSRGMRGLTIRLGRRLNQLFGRRRKPVLAERYHARLLGSPAEVRSALGYVLLNVRKHAAQAGRTLPGGWVDPFSSAPRFEGWSCRTWTDDVADMEGDVVAPPRYWLLRAGWLQAGRLDPNSIPGR